jgi:hypothetical protein
MVHVFLDGMQQQYPEPVVTGPDMARLHDA